jgi:hypothetical protein
MPNKSRGAGPRSFNAMLVTNLSDEARKAVNEAFDAISNWRSETLSNSEKNSGQVIEKMVAAARALGWPEQVVDTTREQLQNITKMQIETLDRMMDAWEEQIKSPDRSFGAAGSWPTADAWQKAGMNPLQLYTHMMGQWQKAWTDAMGFWTKAGTTDDTAGPHRRR